MKKYYDQTQWIIEYIQQAPKAYLFHSQYKLKHPASIIQGALKELIDTISEVISIIPDPLKGFSSKKRADKLLAELFHHFNSLHDESFLVLKGLSPCQNKDDFFKPFFANKWLERHKFTAAEKFETATSETKLWRTIFNKLKHNNAKIMLFEAETICGSIPGFYVEGAINGEILGPDPDVHKPFNGQSTCFSINRFMRQTMYYTLVTIEALKSAVDMHFREVHNYTKNIEFSGKYKDIILPVAGQIAGWKVLFYPDEVTFGYPEIVVGEDNFFCRYPINKFPLSYPETRVKMHQVIDGNMPRFALPYLVPR